MFFSVNSCLHCFFRATPSYIAGLEFARSCVAASSWGGGAHIGEFHVVSNLRSLVSHQSGLVSEFVRFVRRQALEGLASRHVLCNLEFVRHDSRRTIGEFRFVRSFVGKVSGECPFRKFYVAARHQGRQTVVTFELVRCCGAASYRRIRIRHSRALKHTSR